MKELPDYFWADRLTPVNFYGFVSATRDVIYEVDVNKEREAKRSDIERFNTLKAKCLAMCVDMRRENETEPVWTKDVWDGKIVIECKVDTGETIFVGFYDFMYSIGTRVYSHYDRKPRPYKGIEHPDELSES